MSSLRKDRSKEIAAELCLVVFVLLLSCFCSPHLFAQGHEREASTDKSDTVKTHFSGEVDVDGIFRSEELLPVRGEKDYMDAALYPLIFMNRNSASEGMTETFHSEPVMLPEVDLKPQSERIGNALDGFLKEGIKNSFQSSGRLEFDGLLGKWSKQSPGSQASLGDLSQGNNFGGSGQGASGSSSCE